MDADAIYVMDNRQYAFEELCDALEAEAATLPPETWHDGVWDVNDYIIEATQVGIIDTVEDDASRHHAFGLFRAMPGVKSGGHVNILSTHRAPVALWRVTLNPCVAAYLRYRTMRYSVS